MTEQEIQRTTTSEISGIQSHTNFQAIDATFYNLTTTDGRSVASLLVLLDGMHRPVRAELHLYEDLDTFTRDNTVRQAQLLLQDRYYSREAITLVIMYVALDRNAYNVPLPAPESAPASRQGKAAINWTMIGGVVVALLLVVAVIWVGVRLLGGSGGDETAATAETVGADDAAATGEEAGASEGDSTGADTAAGAVESQNLPPSRNARDDLAVGMRVIIQPGFQSNILDQPNVTDGASVGTIQDGEGAQLLDGPVLRQGASDTIVWWYALTDGGIEGWIPANTSQLTLLIPAESQ